MPAPFDGAPGDARALDRRAPDGHAARRGADAARRHAAQPRPVDDRSGSLAPDRRCCATHIAARRLLEAGHALWLLRYARARLERRSRRAARCPTPAGRSTRSARATATCPSCCWGTRWAAAPRSRRRRPQRRRRGRRWRPWFDARRPGRRARRQAPRRRPRPRDRITSARQHPGVHRARRGRRRPRRVPPARAGAGHYLLTGRGGWNRFALRHSLGVLASRTRRTGR